MSTAYASRSRAVTRPLQSNFGEMVQEAFADEYRRQLLRPFSLAAYGTRVGNHKLSVLHKHVTDGLNKVAETTAALTFGPLRMGVGIEDVCGAFRYADSFIRAQLPAPRFDMDDLNLLETEIDSATDPLQMRYATGDHSEKTKLEMLEKFQRIHDVSGQICQQLRLEVYGRGQR